MGIDFLLRLTFLIPLFPLLAFFLITFLGRKLWRQGAGVALLAMVASWVVMLIVNAAWLARLHSAGATVGPWEAHFVWMKLGPAPDLQDVSLQAGYMVDSATAVLLFVVTTVGTLIFWYAMGYMEGDRWYPRFFAYMSLFASAMLGVVISNSLLWFFMCWEIMGLCSYFLIGYWYDKPSAMRAAKKAFVVTRVGDVGFFLGILMIYRMTLAHSLTFSEIFSAAEMHHLAGMNWHIGGIAFPAMTVIALLVLCGSIGKSGQFPLHVWLPDAMEGPTPVSALIHAATMVAAGVFLIARMYPIFIYPALHGGHSTALMIVAGLGAFTAVFAATMALPGHDMKKVLAYSTISQLGYMFMGLGCFGYAAALFHLMTHAFFKALLFLGSGSVHHAVDTYDMREMGSLRRKMPVTSLTFAAGCLALAGIVPFAGFWSKDAILSDAYRANGAYFKVIFALGVIGAFLTAFYTLRMYVMVFEGKPRNEHLYAHAHESPRIMTIPLQILAFGAVFIGLLGIPLGSLNLFGSLVHLPTEIPARLMAAEGIPLTLALWIVSLAFAGAGIWIGIRAYVQRRMRIPEEGGLRQVGLQRWYDSAAQLYHIDEFYQDTLVSGTMASSEGLGRFDDAVVDGVLVNGSAWAVVQFSKFSDWFDRRIVDGLVRAVAWLNYEMGEMLRDVQQGIVQIYALVVFASIFALVVVLQYLR